MKIAKTVACIASLMGVVGFTTTAMATCGYYGSTHMTIQNQTTVSLIKPNTSGVTGTIDNLPTTLSSGQQATFDGCSVHKGVNTKAEGVVSYQRDDNVGQPYVWLYYGSTNTTEAGTTGSCGISYTGPENFSSCNWSNEGGDGVCTCTVK